MTFNRNHVHLEHLTIFNVLLDVHLGKIFVNNQQTWSTILFLCMFISIPYMFRVAIRPLSGELIVSIHLVYVTLYRWPFGVQVQFETQKRISLKYNWIYNLTSLIGTFLILKNIEKTFLISNVCICVLSCRYTRNGTNSMFELNFWIYATWRLENT